MSEIVKPRIVPLLLPTYLAVIKNSVGSKMFSVSYALVDEVKKDITEDGLLSCAFYVSAVLRMFNLIENLHATVSSTVRDIEESGWQKISDLRPGAVIVWSAKEAPNGTPHRHIGFYIGDNEAVSNSSAEGKISRHHYTYGENDEKPVRAIEAIYWSAAFDR